MPVPQSGVIESRLACERARNAGAQREGIVQRQGVAQGEVDTVLGLQARHVGEIPAEGVPVMVLPIVAIETRVFVLADLLEQGSKGDMRETPAGRRIGSSQRLDRVNV